MEDASHVAILARITDLGGLMSHQIVFMAKNLKQMNEKKMELTQDSYRGILEMAAHCREHIEHLLRAFPEMPEDIDKKMRSNDEQLRQLLNWHYKTYLIRLAAKSDSSGMFSEVLFSFERIGSIIRELRKTTISISIPASALNVPDLIDLPHNDEVVRENKDRQH